MDNITLLVSQYLPLHLMGLVSLVELTAGTEVRKLFNSIAISS